MVEYLGWTGGILLVVAYYITGREDHVGLRSYIINAVAGATLLTSAIMSSITAFMFINGFWLLMSIIGIVKEVKKRKYVPTIADLYWDGNA